MDYEHQVQLASHIPLDISHKLSRSDKICHNHLTEPCWANIITTDNRGITKMTKYLFLIYSAAHLKNWTKTNSSYSCLVPRYILELTCSTETRAHFSSRTARYIHITPGNELLNPAIPSILLIRKLTQGWWHLLLAFPFTWRSVIFMRSDFFVSIPCYITHEQGRAEKLFYYCSIDHI